MKKKKTSALKLGTLFNVIFFFLWVDKLAKLRWGRCSSHQPWIDFLVARPMGRAKFLPVVLCTHSPFTRHGECCWWKQLRRKNSPL